MKIGSRALLVLTSLLLGSVCCLMAADGEPEDELPAAQPAAVEEPASEGEAQTEESRPSEGEGQPATDSAPGSRQRSNRADGARTRQSDRASKRSEDRRSGPADNPRDARASARASRDTGGRARSGGNRRGNSRPSVTPADATASTNGSRNFEAFKLIADRNIFNSTRSPRTSRAAPETRQRPNPETLTLVGTMTYEKGAYAFFDGSKSEYRKVLEIGTSIADHKLMAVSGDAVTLQADTNTFALRIGGQLRRNEGKWEVASVGTPAREAGGLPTTAAPAADEDEVVRRLMQKREQELK